MSARDTAGTTAFEAEKPSDMSAMARPRLATNHCATSSVELTNIDPCPSARSAARAKKKPTIPDDSAIPKQAIPSAAATSARMRREPYRSDRRLTVAAITALTPVLIANSTEIVVREMPVSSMIGSMNDEIPNDCPGPELNATTKPTATMIQPR